MMKFLSRTVSICFTKFSSNTNISVNVFSARLVSAILPFRPLSTFSRHMVRSHRLLVNSEHQTFINHYSNPCKSFASSEVVANTFLPENSRFISKVSQQEAAKSKSPSNDLPLLLGKRVSRRPKLKESSTCNEVWITDVWFAFLYVATVHFEVDNIVVNLPSVIVLELFANIISGSCTS